jgi:hypothetical protein
MLRNEAEVSSAGEPEWIVESSTTMSGEELRRSRAKLEEAAKRRGKVIGVKLNRRGDYTVTVEHRNPGRKSRKGGK